MESETQIVFGWNYSYFENMMLYACRLVYRIITISHMTVLTISSLIAVTYLV